MDKALYVGMSGAIHTMRAQAANAHNLANASTVGFRAERYDSMASQVHGDGFTSRFQATMQQSGWDRQHGAVMQTGNPLDIALRDDNWLAVQAPDGTEAYTRAGDLKVDPLGRVMTAAGHQVMGDAGPLSVPPSSTVDIGSDGTITVVPLGQGPEAPAQVGRLKVVDARAEQLQRGKDGLMRAVGDEPLPAAAGEVLVTGALEGSNVNIAESMVNMIDLARQFELQTKAMQTADENARASAQLLRVTG